MCVCLVDLFVDRLPRRHRLVVHYFLCDDTVEVLEKLGRNSGAVLPTFLEARKCMVRMS